MNNRLAVEQLIAHVSVMKPSSIKDDNIKHVARLESLFDSNEYIAEDKIDGCHYLLTHDRFFSTELVEKTHNYPHLNEFFFSLGMPNLILDGEINYPGKTSQYCTRVTGAEPSTAKAFQERNGYIHYTVWDILRTPKGTWLIDKPLYQRRKILEYFYDTYIRGTKIEPYVRLTKWVENNKRQFRDAIWDAGGEGIILKKKDSIYAMGKKPMWQWVKVKEKDTADLFITGYDAPTHLYGGKDFDNWPYWGEHNGASVPVTKFHYLGWIGAIELSAYVNGKITKICTVSGMTEDIRKQISDNRDAFLGRVVKVSFMEKTEAGYPRHPRFEGFHEGKLSTECSWEF